MTQSNLAATVFVTDRKRQSDHPKSPFHIDTKDGTRYKAWPPHAGVLEPGKWYHLGYKVKPGVGEYPDELHVTSATIATDAGTLNLEGGSTGGGGHGGSGTVTVKSGATQEHWDEVDIRRHTVTIWAVLMKLRSYAGASPPDEGATMDEARAIFVGHIERSKNPTIKRVTKVDLLPEADQPEDWSELK